VRLNGFVAPSRSESLYHLVRIALAEDVGVSDWTTAWTVSPDAIGHASVVAKGELVVAGTEAARAVFAAIDPALTMSVARGDGTRAASGDVVLEVTGLAGRILTA
jgi:nicotinate-nucleotide pyrophosphorylase (carboxylating)